jgi:hypothetical protein
MAILTANSGGGSRSRIISSETPPKGRFIATCIEVHDEIGVERQKFESSETEVVDLTTFYFGYKDREGRPHVVKSKSMKLSLHEKAALVKFIKSWSGKPPGAGFDTQSLKGVGAEIRVERVASMKTPGREYANIADIGPVEDDEQNKILPLANLQGLLRDVEPQSAQKTANDLDGDEIPF